MDEQRMNALNESTEERMDELDVLTEQDEMQVGSFRFETLKEAKEAKREQEKIQVLKGKIDFAHTKDMLALYQRLVDKKVFKTPIGYQFLGEFREYLTQELHLDEQEIPHIYVEPKKGMSRFQQEQLDFLQKENQQLEAGRKRSVILIIVLILMIVTMFVITILNPNVGYINTENKILNRYASWEEELTEREERIREREAELGIPLGE